jgi:hypothetical protein
MTLSLAMLAMTKFIVWQRLTSVLLHMRTICCTTAVVRSNLPLTAAIVGSFAIALFRLLALASRILMLSATA